MSVAGFHKKFLWTLQLYINKGFNIVLLLFPEKILNTQLQKQFYQLNNRVRIIYKQFFKLFNQACFYNL